MLHLLTRYVPDHFYSEIPGWPQATVDDHGQLLNAILKRDPEDARTAMREHITHAGDLLANHFDQRIAAGHTPDID